MPRSKRSQHFGLHKEASKSEWTGQELYVCARLLEDIHAYPESARYYFALYNSKGMNDAQERALAGSPTCCSPPLKPRSGWAAGNFPCIATSRPWTRAPAI